MKIGPRTNEWHEHSDTNTCVMQYKRVINDSIFIFTYFGNKEGRTYRVVKVHKANRWEHCHALKVKESPFGVIDENDDIVYMGAKMEAGVDF